MWEIFAGEAETSKAAIRRNRTVMQPIDSIFGSMWNSIVQRRSTTASGAVAALSLWCAPSLAHCGASFQEKIRWQIDFAVSIAKIQLQAGHYFLLENLPNSCAWSEDPLQRLEEDPRVYTVVGHGCAHNLKFIVEPGFCSASFTGG